MSLEAALVEMVPLSRLKPAEWNPRTIHESEFKDLVRSLLEDPDFLNERPILALPDGTIYAGNQKYRAAAHLGWEAVPARFTDIPLWQAQQRALKDNQHFGRDYEPGVQEILATLLEHELDLSTLGYDEKELNRLLDGAGLLGDTEILTAEDRDGMSMEDRLAVFEHGAIRQVVLIFSVEQYTVVVPMLEWIRQHLGVESNTEAVEHLIREFYDANYSAKPASD